MAFIQQSGGISYFQDTVTITSGTLSASASNIAVPSLTYTITEAGNYVIFSMISVDIGGSDAKPFGVMLYKNGVLIPNSLTVDFARRAKRALLATSSKELIASPLVGVESHLI